jgi:hypothetical protein
MGAYFLWTDLSNKYEYETAIVEKSSGVAHRFFVFLLLVVEVASMLSSDEGFSLLNCIRLDGSLDIERALECLYNVKDEHRIDDITLFSCLNAEGGLDMAKFVQMQEVYHYQSSPSLLALLLVLLLLMLADYGLMYHRGHIHNYMKSGMGVLSAKQ